MDLEQLIKLAIAEDQPNGDITTDNLQLNDRIVRALLVAKQDLVLSGSRAFEMTVKNFDSDVQVKWHFSDGQKVLKGQTVCVLKGRAAPLLKAERIGLNFIGHLSGIATLTEKFVAQVKHTKTKILDTRKTTPLFRQLEKKAVKDGGGTNHRMSLSDAVMIKDNHIEASGGISEAIEKIREETQSPIEVEVQNLDQIRAAVQLDVKRIMLDNMSVEEMKEALKFIPPSIETEASGNMSLEKVKAVAETGVTFISVGALTHSAPNADFSLKFEWKNL